MVLFAAVHPVSPQSIHKVSGVARIVQVQARPVGKRRQPHDGIQRVPNQYRIEVAEVGRHNDHRAFSHELAHRLHMPAHQQSVLQPVLAAPKPADIAAGRRIEQAGEKQGQKTAGKQEGLFAECPDNFFRIAVDDALQQLLIGTLGFFLPAVQGMAHQFALYFFPKLPLVGRVHFPGFLLHADAFPVDGFGQYVRLFARGQRHKAF